MKKSQSKVTIGPFTWIKREPENGHESWDLVRDECALLPIFCLKNYGGTPGPGFNGWKLVSGGPFDSAGIYSSFDDAANGVIPFLSDYLTRKANEQIEAALKAKKLLTKFNAKLARSRKQ